MTNRKQALQELLAKVDAGEWEDMELAYKLSKAMNPVTVRHAYNGSLDAALVLHNAVLPDESKWQLTWEDGSYDFALSHKGMVYGTCITKSPARAWLIAILKALMSGEDE